MHSPSVSLTRTDDRLRVQPRGPLSAALMSALQRVPSGASLEDVSGVLPAIIRTEDPLRDEDFQLSLFLLYALHYGSIPQLDDGWEWDPALLSVRAELEAAFEISLRRAVTAPARPDATQDAVAAALFTLTTPTPGPSLSRFMAKSASVEQSLEFLMQRSIYTLREADPHSWAIPRLTGRAKAALVEIQSDEYGGGRPHRMHAEIFARTMRATGLDPAYAAYLDVVPAITLASVNMMSLFGLHRRLRGCIVGHLAAFEMTSSIPNRSYGDGFRRLGFGVDVTEYFNEHVEADAVHEQIAGRDLAGALAEDDSSVLEDIMFGAAACLAVDGWASDHILQSWESGVSSLRVPLPAS